MVFMRNLIGGVLAELEDDIDRDKFKRLLHYSRRLAAFQNRAKLVSNCPCIIFMCGSIYLASFLGSRSFGRGSGAG